MSSTRHDTGYYVALVLQGGGALGAYHIGVYQALHEAGYQPDWVSGISIGSINSAIIVGNPPEERLGKLEALWDAISRPDGWGVPPGGELRKWFNWASASSAILLGQPHFFTPRFPSPLLSPPGLPGSTSFYDTSPLRDTLLHLADFERINSGPVRLSLGATRVRTGELVFFDNRTQSIAPEHVVASGSLPPGFPPTTVEGDQYWDGGCVSNTPLQAITDDPPDAPTLVFVIDLWNPQGPLPTSIDDVTWRQKQIQYASRTTYHIDSSARQHELRHSLNRLSRNLPADAPRSATARRVMERGYEPMYFCHIIYEPGADQVPLSDAEFSRASIAARRAAGYSDMRNLMEQSPWSRHPALVGEPAGASVYEVRGGRISSRDPLARPAPHGVPRNGQAINPTLTPMDIPESA